MKSKPLVSIIITSKNEEKVIRELITSLLNQTYKNMETILVDNNSSDSTLRITSAYNIKIYNFGPERSAQRNYGASKAQGDYLLFLDADMRLEPRVVEECLQKVSSRRVGAVIIPEESYGEGFWNKVKAFERSFYNADGDNTTEAARFFRREAFNKAGGYDEKITGPEDWDLPETIKKIGYKIERISSRILHQENISSLSDLARKKYYYALRSHRYLKKQNISPLSAKTVYFLRPVFYKKWRKLILNPILTLGMFLMFSVELASGGLGYLIGRFKNI